jgi:hypothetical protein
LHIQHHRPLAAFLTDEREQLEQAGSIITE